MRNVLHLSLMKHFPLYAQILLGLIFGALCGTFSPSVIPWIDWMGVLFMNALGMLIVPIIFFSISTSVFQISGRQDGSLGRISLKTLFWYVLTMLIAVITGIILVSLIHPGRGLEAVAAGIVPDTVVNTGVKDIITGFIPSNIFAAFSGNNTIPVIFIAILVGIFGTRIGAKEGLGKALQAGYDITLQITGWVLRFAPLGVAAVVAVQFSRMGDSLGLIRGMLLYVLTVTAGLVIHTFLTLPLLLRFVGNVNPWKHLGNMSVPLLTAFSTASSGATLPLTLEAVEKKDGVSARVSRFVVSLGATINMSGTALLECVAVIFIAQAYGVPLTLVQTLIIVFTAILCAIGSAGVPMAAMVMMAIILGAVGLPAEGIGLVIGIDRILDMMRTAVNVYGDTCVAVLVARSEGEKLPIDNK